MSIPLMSIPRCVSDMVAAGVSNLNSGDIAHECELAFSCAKEGCEVVLDKDQDPDGKLEETLVSKYGLHVVEPLGDGSNVVLTLHTNADVSSTSVTVDAVLEPDDEKSSTSIHRGAAKDVLPDSKWTWLPGAVKVELDSVNWKIHGEDQTVWAETFFRRSYCREGDSSTLCARLVLDEINVGVENCFTNKDKDKRGFFIYKMSVTATPFGTWKDTCTRISGRPSPEGSDVLHEKAFTCGLTGAASASNPVGVTVQRSSKSAAATKDFAWLPCKTTKSTKAVTWTWEMLSWKGGSSVKLDKDSRILTGALPKLPFDPESFGQDSSAFVADAYWEIPEMNQEDLANIEWSIEIQIHYAFLERAYKIGNALSLCKAIMRKNQILSCVKLL